MTKIENVTINYISEHEPELTITLPGEFVSKQYEHALTHLQRKASRPGFRPGKMPRNMVQSLFSAELKSSLIKKLMEDGLQEALENENLVPVSDPKFEAMGECEREKAFTYKAVFQKKPTIEVKTYEGLTFEIKEYGFNDQDIEDELQNLREVHATLVSPKDRSEVGPNDVVTCDSEVTIGGVKMTEHSYQDYAIPVFDKNVPENVRLPLIGKSIGDTVTVSYEIPNDHQDEEIKGKLCEMLLTVKEIKERVLPNLDDDFAKDLSEKFSCLDDVRESIKIRFTLTARRRNDYFKQDGITRALVQANPFEVPPALVERMALNLINRELESLPRNVAEDAIKNRWADMWQQVQAQALFRVKAQLLFEALIEKLEVKASDEEISAYIKRVKDVAREDASYTIQVEKLLDAVLKSSSVTVVKEPLFG